MVSYLDHQHRHRHHHHHHHHQVMLMGSSPAELTLGLMPFTDKADGDEAGCGGHGRKASKQLELEHYLKSLEEEKKKIEAFKRELPFCMALLTTAIEASKEQLASHLRNPPSESKDSLEVESGHCHTPNREDDGASIATIFRPLNQAKAQGSEDVSPWLHGTTAQTTKFWSLEEAYAHGEEMVSSIGNGDIITCCNNGGGGSSAIMKPIPISCERRGGAFTPFLKAKNTSGISVVEQTSPREVSSSPIAVGDKEDYGEIRSPSSSSPQPNGTSHRESRPAPTASNASVKNASARISNAAPQTRKQRRCWSPELHRRFVHALHQLGGSQCATPKQIRELMNVDDLTNDEVKSHLQKYRLHTRRQTSGSFEKAAMVHDVPQLVVLGGIWVPQGFTSEGFKQQPIASALPSETHLCLISSSGDAKHRRESAHESYSEEDNSEAEDGRVY